MYLFQNIEPVKTTMEGEKLKDRKREMDILKRQDMLQSHSSLAVLLSGLSSSESL